MNIAVATAWQSIAVPSGDGCDLVVIESDGDVFLGDPNTGWCTLPKTIPGQTLSQELIGKLETPSNENGVITRFAGGQNLCQVKAVSGTANVTVKFMR